MSSKRLHFSLLLVPCFLSFGIAGCGDDETQPPIEQPPKEDPPKEDPPKEDPPKEDPPKEDPPIACIDQTFQQPKLRFVAGTTYYLPTLADKEGCRDLSWKLTSAPEGNANEVVKGADGIWRFTPVLAGGYAFDLGEKSEEKVEFAAIDPSDNPFHNYGYWATHSVAEVSGEIWTANVYDPSITRTDPTTLEVVGSITVGPWPVAIAWSDDAPYALVAHRGGDTLGLIDVQEHRLIDAIWVGDEPTNVVLSPDGKKAYVALGTESAVAVVDLEARGVIARVPTGGWEPTAMALTKDGAKLYVASHKSGTPQRFPFTDDPVSEEKDITVIDTTTNAVAQTFMDVGNVINGLQLSDDDSQLYVSTVRTDTSKLLVDPTATSFMPSVVVLDAETGDEVMAADLARQATSAGPVVGPHEIALSGDALWVAVEGQDVVLQLDAQTLEEVSRLEAKGRPRGVIATEGGVYVHGAQSYLLTRASQGETTSTATGTDPRPPTVSLGSQLFTGAGQEVASTWSCGSCHTDSLNDTMVWNAGVFPDRYVSKPLVWEEGSGQYGWLGRVSTHRNYSWMINLSVGMWPVTEVGDSMTAYIGSLMPPPAANGATLRDGRLSEAGLRGKALYEGKGSCAGCHALPLTTNGLVVESGITEGGADVPILVGAYRYGVWMKHGEGRTLQSAVELAVNYVGAAEEFSDEELSDLTHYLQELTGRDFFVLASEPGVTAASVPVDDPIRLTFSLPLFADEGNLARIKLREASGAEVPVTATVDDRYVTLTPAAPLTASTEYVIVVDGALESFDERKMFSATEIPFTTAKAPKVTLEGSYVFTVEAPIIDMATFTITEETQPLPVPVQATKTASGAHAVFDLGFGSLYDATVVVDDDKLVLPGLIVPFAPILANGSEFSEAELVDSDDDGIGDTASGTLTMGGAGVHLTNVRWTLARP
ncbi:Ig-like domain-containing protein [Sorangium sp. So ce429]